MGRSQLKAGAFLSYLSLFLGNAISIIYTPIMLRLLGQSEYGLFMLSNSVIGLLGIINFGLGSTVVRYSSKYRAMNDKKGEYALYGLFFLISSIVSILVILFGSILVFNVETIFSGALTKEELNTIKILMYLMVFNLAITFLFSIFNSIILVYEKFIFLKVVGLMQTIINPLFMLPLLLMGYKSITMTIVSTILTIITISLNVLFCFKYIKIKVTFNKFDSSLLKEIAGFSFFIFLNIVVDKIYWSTNQFILGIVSGTAAVAVYTIGLTFNTYFMSFSTAVSGLFLPRITEMVTKDTSYKVLSDFFIRVGRLQYIILSFILGGFVLIGMDFIKIWAGSRYESSYFIALVVMIPLTVPLIQTIGLTILQAKNMHKFRSLVYLAIAILNIIFSIPLAKLWGGLGCAMAMCVSMIIGHIIIMNIYYKKKINIDISSFWRNILSMSLPLIISLILGGLINIYITEVSIITLLIKGFIYCVIFISLMWFTGMNKSEKDLLIGSLINILNKFINNKVKIVNSER
ncbi:lipopolysaccharide biosynthesis protein [Metabacillus litoralis]|uniref:lipopolysaccharide biosynthesis protein n=1 Tax=Metabacillus litoralis TaxID=152268 RepID=UPI001CFD1349|nr:oligosaccharide flippase family protein [Metabacillus litoralis]